MVAADLAAVAAIEAEVQRFPWSQAVFADCLSAGYEAWLIDDGGLPVAFGILSAAAAEAHLLNLAVARHSWGQGHGQRMISRLLDLARWHRVERVFLEVRPSNARAMELYRRMGFAEIGRRPRYYQSEDGREDAIVMERLLGVSRQACPDPMPVVLASGRGWD